MVSKDKVKCNLCGSDDNKLIITATDRLHGFEGKFNYVKCSKCSLVFMNPRPGMEDMGSFYPSQYSPHKITKKTASPKTGFLQKIRQFRKDFFQNVKIIKSVKKKINSEATLLDVGCGNGDFLNNIQQQTSCRVSGVDISENAVKAARENYNIEVFRGIIEDAPYDAESFDIVTSWWYLEHVPDPSGSLEKMAELLKPDGTCIIAVPNIASFNAYAFKDKWYHLDCPRHLYLYSPKTISRLLDKAGMKVDRIMYDRTAWGLLRSLRYVFGNDAVPFSSRKKLKGSSLIKKMLLPVTLLFSLLGISDTMVIYAAKK